MPKGSQIPKRGLRAPLRNVDALGAGLTDQMVRDGLAEAYRLLDLIDTTLLGGINVRLADLVELANLSSMLGNLVATAIVNSSGGVFARAGAHKYQDLRANHSSASNVEIKIALEDNKPKGHLAKAGYYLTVRYVLGNNDGTWDSKKRGRVVWIWEIRFGHLKESDFAISNTAGDSGKTAVVTTEGMKKLRLIYFDQDLCPYKRIGEYLHKYGR